MTEAELLDEWWRSVEIARHPNVYLDLCSRPWSYQLQNRFEEWKTIFDRLLSMIRPETLSSAPTRWGRTSTSQSPSPDGRWQTWTLALKHWSSGRNAAQLFNLPG